MGLTDAERKFYDKNGYVLKKGLIPSGEISHIEREIAGLARANGRKHARQSRDLMGRI